MRGRLGENQENSYFSESFIPLMRLLTTCLLLLGFGLFLTGETWLWLKKNAQEEPGEVIDYAIQGDSLHAKVPMAIPYLNQSFESNSAERVIFVEDAYFLVTRTYFSGDTLHTVGHRIQPDRQAMFSILGQLIQIHSDAESSPEEKALELLKQMTKFCLQSPSFWMQWFWVEWVKFPVPALDLSWEAALLGILSPPPCQVK